MKKVEMMNKKGQIAQGIIWFNVFLFLIILMTIYLVLSAALSGTRGLGKVSLAYFNSEENVLLRSFYFDGKQRIIFDSLFRMGGLDGKQGKEKELYERVTNEINDFSKENMKNYGKEFCVMVSSPFAYFFSKNGKADANKETQLPLYKSNEGYNEINLNIKGEEKVVAYYGGECIR